MLARCVSPRSDYYPGAQPLPHHPLLGDTLKNGPKNRGRINDKTHAYNMQSMLSTSTTHISVSPLITLTTFLTFTE